MPVLNLQRDTRWAELGAGVGNLLGNALGEINQRVVAQGVQQIWQDPNISDEQKLLYSSSRFGAAGTQLSNQILQNRKLLEQLDLEKAQAEQARAHAGYFRDMEQLLPARAGLLGAQTAAAGAEVPLRQAEALRATAGAQKEVAEAGAIPSLIQQRRDAAGLASARTEKVTGEIGDAATERWRQQYYMFKAGIPGVPDPGPPPVAGTGAAIGQPVPEAAPAGAALGAAPQPQAQAATPAVGTASPAVPATVTPSSMTATGEDAQIEGMLDPFRNLTAQDKAAAKNIYYGTLMGRKATPQQAQKAMIDYAKTANTQKEVRDTPKELGDAADAATAFADSANRFMSGFEKEPSTGLASLTKLDALLEAKGFGRGDESLLNMLKGELFLQAANSRSMKSAFFSKAQWDIAHDLTPNLSYSPLSNVILMDMTAQRMKDHLQNQMDRIGSKPAQMKVAQDAMQQIDQFQDRLHQIHSMAVPSPGGGLETIVTWNGSQLDSGSFRTVVGADTKYRVGGRGSNEWATGRQVVEAAEKLKEDPRKVAAKMGVNLDAIVRDTGAR